MLQDDRFPPSASVRILTLPSGWAEISWAGWGRLGHTLGCLVSLLTVCGAYKFLFQGSAPPLSQPRQVSFPICRHWNYHVHSQLRGSFSAALSVLSSVPADSLGIMQIPRMSEKPKYEIFNPFNFSALEPRPQKHPALQRAVLANRTIISYPWAQIPSLSTRWGCRAPIAEGCNS